MWALRARRANAYLQLLVSAQMDIERTATLRRGLFHNVGDLNLDGTLTRTRAATSSAVSGSLSLQLSGDELVNYRQLFNSARNGDVQKVKELLTGALGLSDGL